MRHLRALTLAGAATVFLAGCSVPSVPVSATQAPTTVPSASATAPVPAPDPGGPAATPSAGPASEQPVGTRPASFDKVRVQGSLYPIQRTGDTTTVNLLIESQNPDQTFMIFSALSDHNPETSSKDTHAVDGLRLIDPTAKKAYLPATTADGSCLCSPTDGLSDEQSSLWVTVVFAAPPSTVSTVDVFVPRFGTFNHVPVR